MRLLLLLSLLLSPSAHAKAPDGSFFVGYNQPWFNGDYGYDLTTKFDPDSVRRTYKGIREAGGTVTRIFLFTGLQGISYAKGVPAGVSAQFLRNFETLLGIARQTGLKVYVTPLQVGEALQVQGDWRQFYVNVLLNPKMTGEYNEKVLGPVLEVLNRNRDVVFALDLANEVDALTNKSFASEEQLRLWVWLEASFVKAHSPWLQKTASVGWGGAQYLLARGLMSGLQLDFYDLHIYSDDGAYRGMTDLCKRAQSDGKSIVLGEFGQKSTTVDDSVQYWGTKRFLETAFSQCFSGALAWVFEDTKEPWFAFHKPDGSLRPAASLIRSFPRR